MDAKYKTGMLWKSFGLSNQSPQQVCDKSICVALMKFSPRQSTGKVRNKVRDKVHENVLVKVADTRHEHFVTKSAWRNLGFSRHQPLTFAMALSMARISDMIL